MTRVDSRYVWLVRPFTSFDDPTLSDFDWSSPTSGMFFSEDDAWREARRLSRENDLCPIQEIHFDTTPSPKKELPR